jgi:hypothetical protein
MTSRARHLLSNVLVTVSGMHVGEVLIAVKSNGESYTFWWIYGMILSGRVNHQTWNWKRIHLGDQVMCPFLDITLKIGRHFALFEK